MPKPPLARFRALLLTAIALTALITGGTYAVRARLAARNRPAPPEKIPPTLLQSAQGFSVSKSEGGRTLFKAEARKAVDFRETGKSELEDVEIVIYGASGDRADRISSRRCEYDSKTGLIYSEGEVEIELASLPGEAPVPAAARAAASAPIRVKTSGLVFDQNTGLASTDRDLSFRIRRGSGQARGAVYDSRQQTLWLKADVRFVGESRGPVEAQGSELHYLQREFQIRITRPEFRRKDSAGRERILSGDEATLILDERNELRGVFLTGGVTARDISHDRQSELHADRLDLTIGAEQQLETALATGNVRLDSRGPSGRSESRADRLEMAFTGRNSALRQSQWKGRVRMVLFPAASSGPVKTITSEEVEVVMTPDGRELDAARTKAPGRLEISGGSDPRRVLTADSFWINFDAHSQAKLLRAEGKVQTETDSKPRRLTASDLLVATFTPQSQHIETLEQTGHFRFEEGDRQARGERAYYTAANETTVLTGKPGEDPQVWDSGGRTAARRITFQEKTGQVLAELDVQVTQLPSKDEKSPGLLRGASAKSGEKQEPVHARTQRLEWDRQSGLTRYESGPGQRVRLWQGGDVLEARTVEIDRKTRKLTASGEVSSVLTEEGRDPVRITAERLTYSEADNRARYERNVVLKSDDVTVSAAELEAVLLPAEEVKEGRSRLQRAVATGRVRLNQPARPPEKGKPAVPARRAESERADYFRPEDKVLLSGGNPVVYDDVRGSTTGRELTYYIADDKVFVVGDDNARTVTQHRVAKKPR